MEPAAEQPGDARTTRGRGRRRSRRNEPAAEQPGDAEIEARGADGTRCRNEPAAEQPGDEAPTPERIAAEPPQWSRLLNSRVTHRSSLGLIFQLAPQWSRLLNSRVTAREIWCL